MLGSITALFPRHGPFLRGYEIFRPRVFTVHQNNHFPVICIVIFKPFPLDTHRVSGLVQIAEHLVWSSDSISVVIFPLAPGSYLYLLLETLKVRSVRLSFKLDAFQLKLWPKSPNTTSANIRNLQCEDELLFVQLLTSVTLLLSVSLYFDLPLKESVSVIVSHQRSRISRVEIYFLTDLWLQSLVSETLKNIISQSNIF